MVTVMCGHLSAMTAHVGPPRGGRDGVLEMACVDVWMERENECQLTNIASSNWCEITNTRFCQK